MIVVFKKEDEIIQIIHFTLAMKFVSSYVMLTRLHKQKNAIKSVKPYVELTTLSYESVLKLVFVNVATYKNNPHSFIHSFIHFLSIK